MAGIPRRADLEFIGAMEIGDQFPGAEARHSTT